MTFRALLVSAAVMTLSAGCYFETIDDMEERSPTDSDSPSGPNLRGEEGTCTYTLATGCFDGYIASKQNFTVDGQEFFNADALANGFHELIAVEGKNAAGEDLVYGEDYTIELTTEVDNKNFYSDFSYDLIGEVAKGKSIRTGGFSIDKLPAGAYDLRIQRAIKFNFVQTVTRQPDDGSQPVTEQVKYGRCATLYQDAVIDIRAGQRTRENFNSFAMHLSDNECAADGNDTVITLP